MALFLLHRTAEHERNSSGIHAVLCEAANEGAARAAAAAAAPTGETRIHAGWAAVQIASSSTLPRNPIFFEGDAVSLLTTTRGGNPI